MPVILALGVAALSGGTLLVHTVDRAAERQAPNLLAWSALALAALVIWRAR